MRRSYLVRVTAYVCNTDSPEPDREFRVSTLVPAFSLADARFLSERITSESIEGVRRTCEIVVKVYVDNKCVYIPVSHLRNLAQEFSDYYSDYADDRGEDTQHDPIVTGRFTRAPL